MDKCPACNKDYLVIKGQVLCRNIACVNYNVIVRRTRANKQIREEKKILIQEEE